MLCYVNLLSQKIHSQFVPQHFLYFSAHILKAFLTISLFLRTCPLCICTCWMWMLLKCYWKYNSSPIYSYVHFYKVLKATCILIAFLRWPICTISSRHSLLFNPHKKLMMHFSTHRFHYQFLHVCLRVFQRFQPLPP